MYLSFFDQAAYSSLAMFQLKADCIAYKSQALIFSVEALCEA